MKSRRFIVGSLVLAAASTGALFAMRHVDAESSDQGLPPNGGQVRLDALPPEILTMGPRGCLMLRADGSPITVSMREIAAGSDAQRSDEDEATPSTMRPGEVSNGIEDCSIDADRAAELVASGVPPQEAVDASRIDP